MNESKDLIKEAFVSFFFLGRSPVAPGTAGAFGSLILAYLIVENIVDYSGYLLLGLSSILYYTGLQIAPWCEDRYGKDPGIYVIDEVIGYLIAISFLIIFGVDLTHTPEIWVLSFISFRIFDVLKIWPAKDLENMKGGHGIILDDVAAGFQTLIFVLLIIQFNII